MKSADKHSMLCLSVLRRSGALQLSSLPEVVACSAAYASQDFATCLTASERALEIASKYLPASRDFVVLSAVAGRCCWRLNKFVGAAAHFQAAAATDPRFRAAAVRAAAELAPLDGVARDEFEGLNLGEINRCLTNGNGKALPASLVAELRSSQFVGIWVSAGEAAVLGRVELDEEVTTDLLKRVLETSLPQVPSFAGLRPRALQSLGTLHFRAKQAVTAEGLFRAAIDEWAEYGTLSPRARVHRAQGHFAYADFLRKWEGRERHGDEEADRALKLLRGNEITEDQSAWAALVLPGMDTASLIEELWSE